ncbi:MAG: RNA polymerase sigma factor [Phycisphaerae bacterium]
MEVRSTQTTLLGRLRNLDDHVAWCEFEERYRELLLRFGRRQGLQHADADDVVQHVFTNLARTLPSFTYSQNRGRFRDYLLRCVRNAIVDWSRRPGVRVQSVDSNIEDPDAPAESAIAAAWEEEWVAHHYRLAMRTIRETHEPRSVELFDRSIAGASLADLAREFGMSEDAVRKVRARIRDRMEELIAAQVRDEDAVDG